MKIGVGYRDWCGLSPSRRDFSDLTYLVKVSPQRQTGGTFGRPTIRSERERWLLRMPFRGPEGHLCRMATPVNLVCKSCTFCRI